MADQISSGQRAWEIASGMRGYVGSAAELQDRREMRFGWREYPIDHPLIERHVALAGSVLLHANDRLYRGKHYVVRRDGGGYYIRQGKRGTTKSYLARCHVTYANGEPILFQYRLARAAGHEGEGR